MSSPDVPPSFHPHHLRRSETFPPTDSSQLLLHDDGQKCRPLVVRERNSSKLNKLLFSPPVARKIQVCRKGRRLFSTSINLTQFLNFYGFTFEKENFYRTYPINISYKLVKITRSTRISGKEQKYLCSCNQDRK